MAASRQNPAFALKAVLKSAGSVKGMGYREARKSKGLTVFVPGKNFKSSNHLGGPGLPKISSEKQVVSPLIKSRNHGNHGNKLNMEASVTANHRIKRRRKTVIDLRTETPRRPVSLSPIERKWGGTVNSDDTLLTLIADIDF